MEYTSSKELAVELLEMAEADQSMRAVYQTTNEWDASIDEVNTARLKEIVDAEGWPTISKVGKKAAFAAWTLAQHADKDPAFQDKCLELMKQQPEGDVALWSIALLEDRVRMNTGRPQLYGTQFRMREGEFGPLPIEDEANIEMRRAAMGLEPFEEYSRGMREMYEEYQKALNQ